MKAENRNSIWLNRSRIVCLASLAVLLSACAAVDSQRTFDLESERTGAVDDKGFPIFLGPQYERDTPLKRRVERAELERELQALAESRKKNAVVVDQRRNEIVQKELGQIARTHSANTQAEITAACQTDANGIVTCDTD